MQIIRSPRFALHTTQLLGCLAVLACLPAMAQVPTRQAPPPTRATPVPAPVVAQPDARPALQPKPMIDPDALRPTPKLKRIHAIGPTDTTGTHGTLCPSPQPLYEHAQGGTLEILHGRNGLYLLGPGLDQLDGVRVVGAASIPTRFAAGNRLVGSIGGPTSVPCAAPPGSPSGWQMRLVDLGTPASSQMSQPVSAVLETFRVRAGGKSAADVEVVDRVILQMAPTPYILQLVPSLVSTDASEVPVSLLGRNLQLLEVADDPASREPLPGVRLDLAASSATDLRTLLVSAEGADPGGSFVPRFSMQVRRGTQLHLIHDHDTAWPVLGQPHPRRFVDIPISLQNP